MFRDASVVRRTSGSYVAHALLRAVSRLVSILVPGVMKTLASIDTSVDAARLGAYATKAFKI
jgi:hypothetical protein